LAGRLFRYASGDDAAEAFVVEPAQSRGSILVIHEVWGFNGYVRAVCARLARCGYAAYAPILYWRDKRLFSAERMREAMNVVWDLPLEERYDRRKMERAIEEKRADRTTATLLRTLYDRSFRSKMLGDVVALATLVSGQLGGIGTVGYSMGGGLSLRLAAEFPRLRACVVFSARPPGDEFLERIRAPMLAMYGSRDDFMTGDLPAFVRSAIVHGRELTLKTYPSVGHEFFDWTKAGGREKEAAEDAWRATQEFLDHTFL